MAWMLARLVEAEGERWRLITRGHEQLCHLPIEPDLRPGDLVLLQGEPGDWRAVQGPLHAGSWPAEIPRELAALDHEDKRLNPLFSARGDWLIDPAGHPCEHGLLRVGAETFAHVLSYAGWRLGDIEGEDARFERYTLGEAELLVLRADGAPPPRDEGEALPRYPLPRFEEAAPAATTWPAAPPPAPVAPKPAPSQLTLTPSPPIGPPTPRQAADELDVQVFFSELKFGAGEVDVCLPRHGQVRAVAPWSFPELDALKADVAKLLQPRAFVHVHGPAEARVADEPPELYRYFEQARWSAFEATIAVSEQWVDLDKIREHLPQSEQDDATLLRRATFGVEGRVEALKVLFALRVAGQPTIVLPKRGVLFVVSPPSSGQLMPPMYVVWESIEEGNATYIFHWKGEPAFAKIQTFTQQPDWRNQLRKKNPNVSAELGFSEKIIHKASGDEDPFISWEKKLKAAMPER